MSDKILYEPKEGTTGFWGLREVPEEPKYCTDFGDIIIVCGDTFCKCEGMLRGHREALESCKEKKLEIVNPMDAIRTFLDGTPCIWGKGDDPTGWYVIKPGDLFDLPIGYEFKEEYIDGSCGHPCDDYKDECQFNGCKHQGDVKVLRLVNTESGLRNGLNEPLETGEQPDFPQPEPEESQTELFSLVYRMMDQGGRPEDNFTIQRKKQ